MKRLLTHRFAPHIVLTLATLVWGGSFVVTRGAVQNVPPLIFVGVRFGTAAIFVAIATRPRLSRVTRIELKAGSRIACAMFGVYGMQALGMSMGVSGGRAAFISALYVPTVPILQLVLLRRRPKPAIWAGLGLASAGLMLLAGPLGAAGAGAGEAVLLISAISIAAEITMVGLYAARVDPRRLAIVECTILSAACFAATPATGASWPASVSGWLLSAAALGVASAGLQISANWAQRYVPPARATLIYTMEPVWAALFGLAAGERMGPGAVAGAALILASLLVSGR